MKHNLQSRLACQPIYLLVNEIASTILQITLYPVNLTGNGCRVSSMTWSIMMNQLWSDDLDLGPSVILRKQ